MQRQLTDTDRPLYWILSSAMGGLLILALVVLTMYLHTAESMRAPVAGVNAAPSNQLKLDIIAPMTMTNGSSMGPMYTPDANLVVPAHTLVTVTIINRDLGDTTMSPNSPYALVTSVTDGMARVDGSPYSKLDPAKVAHTFTIPRMGVNVPIPGDSATGQSSLTVTFSFMTGADGVFDWRCMDPCGNGPSGWEGPMATPGQMMGTLTVVG